MRTLSRALRVMPWVLGAMLLSTQWVGAQGDAYCYIRSVDIKALSNGVQIELKADGILSWEWQRGGDGGELTEIAIRFPDARIGVDKTLYDVDQAPVSAVTLSVPQNATGGKGVVMNVTMSEPSRVEPSLSEDRQTFLLVVFGTRTVERTRRADTPPEAMAEGFVAVEGHDGLVSVRAVKADIHKVVLEIARQASLSAAVDDMVQHKISVNVRDRDPLEVIRGIAAGYGLALSCVGDVYMLSEGLPSDLPTYRRSGTASFPMKYLKARDAFSLLPAFLFMYVHDNPEQNAVVATAPTQMLEKIGKDLQAVDVPPPMIMVECAVAELTDSGDLDAGLKWRYESAEHEATGDTTTGDVGYREVDTASGLVTAIAATAKLQVWLQGLITQGRAEVQAHPSMAAVNGKRAGIFIGSQRFIKVQYLRSGQSQERIESVPVGVRLDVRPWTGGNSEITTWVNVEVSNIVAIDPETGLPRLGSRKASTTMRTRDGDTIVIGGLSQRQEDRTYRRIPILGDLPIIGPLFRSQSKRESNTELVILIRPRLLDPSGRLPEEEDRQIRGEFLQEGDLDMLNLPLSNRAHTSWRRAMLAASVAAFLLALAAVSQAEAPPAVGEVVYETGFEQADPLAGWSGSGTIDAGYDSPRALAVAHPEGEAGGGAAEQIPLPVERVRGCTLNLSCMVRAEDVSEKPQSWNGIKFMLPTVSPGGPQWPQATLPAGTFDWRPATFSFVIPEDATQMRLHLGLEAVTGKVWFDDIKIVVRKLPFVAKPPVTSGAVYTGRDLPRLRGAMVQPRIDDESLRTFGCDWNANVVRWQLAWWEPTGPFDPAAYRAWLEGQLAYLDAALPLCEKYGLYVVVDLHGWPSGSDDSGQSLFTDPACQETFIESWKMMAERYRDSKAVWGYDLINEPDDRFVADGVLDWQGLCEKAARAVRVIDSEHAIIVECPYGANPSGFEQFNPIDVPGVVYSLHMYRPHEFSSQGVHANYATPYRYPGEIAGEMWDKARLEAELRPAIDFQKRYRTHIYVGEFSAARWAPDESAYRYLRDAIDIFEANGWDWTYHAFRESNIWSVEMGPDPSNLDRAAEPTPRERLLRRWFSRNEKPAW